MDRALQVGVGERLDTAAVVADEVMVVLAARVHRLEAGAVTAELDPLHETVARQLFEGAVDGSDSDAAASRPQLVEDLLRAEAAVLSSQQLDHSPARAAVAVPLRLQRLEGRLRPLVALDGLLHEADDSVGAGL
jgi:hypothetical protein